LKVWLALRHYVPFGRLRLKKKVLYEDFENSIIGFPDLVSLEFGLEGWVKVLQGRLVGGGGS